MSSSGKAKEKTSSNKAKGKADVDSKFDWSRTVGPDPRDPRNAGAPCHGSREPAPPGRGSPSGANAHATWVACSRCRMRLSYTPAYGSHGLTRQAGALPADTKEMVETLGNNADYSEKLRDRNIGLEGAEKSCLTQLAKIQAQKAAYNQSKTAVDKPKTKVDTVPKEESFELVGATTTATSSATPTVVIPDEDHSMLPGRKGRKIDAAEEHEANQRS